MCACNRNVFGCMVAKALERIRKRKGAKKDLTGKETLNFDSILQSDVTKNPEVLQKRRRSSKTAR